MTLYRQLALFLSLLMMLILTTVMMITFTHYITASEESLTQDAQNTAASLSLALAVANGDESTIATMINANFDSGHYKRIVFVNMEDEVVFERLQEQVIADVPSWFMEMFEIESFAALTQVSSGWMVIGQLIVQSDANESYHLLYKAFKSLLYTFGLYLFASLFLLNLLLLTLLAPLKQIQKQAELLIKGKFSYQKELPNTTEFKEIVMSMNAMVDSLESSYSDHDASLACMEMQQLHDLWRDRLKSALQQRHFDFILRNSVNLENHDVKDKTISIVMHGDHGHDYFYGSFIEAAVREKCVFEIYQLVLQKLFESFSEKDRRAPITFAFATSLLEDENTIATLQEQFEKFENDYDVDFCIEIPEIFILEHEEQALHYIKLIKDFGFRFGVCEMSALTTDYSYLARVDAGSIKMSKIIYFELLKDHSDRLDKLKDVADKAKMRVIITGVSSYKELEQLKADAIIEVQGAITELL